MVSRVGSWLLLVALLATGCTSDPGRSGADPSPDLIAPTPFTASTQEVPDGFRRVQCSDLRGEERNTGLAVRIVVPPRYHDSSRQGGGCSFVGPGFGRDLGVSFGSTTPLSVVKEKQIDPFVDVGGDDSLSDVEYAADVPVFGEIHGERLTYYCYCDGQDLDQYVLAAQGVVLSWSTPHGKGPTADEIAAVTSGLALVRSRVSTCTVDGVTARFRPPIPQTESIDVYRRSCHLYLRPGRNSLQRYAAIVPSPRRDIDEVAASWRARKRISGVRIARDGGRLDGQPADRLTWRYTREHASQYGQPAGTWRGVLLATDGLQVTWSARPRQWHREADVVRRFVDSVRLPG